MPPPPPCNSYYVPYLSASAKAAAASRAAEAAEAAAAALSRDLAHTVVSKNAEISDISSKYQRELNEMDDNLKKTQQHKDEIKNELENTMDELHRERSRAKSMSEEHHKALEDLNSRLANTAEELHRERSRAKSMSEEHQKTLEDLNSRLDDTNNELHQERVRAKSVSEDHHRTLEELNAKLEAAEEKLSTLEPRAELAKQLERDIWELKDEIKAVKTTNSILADHNELQSRIIRSRACSPVVVHYSRPCSPVLHYSRPCSPVFRHHVPRSCSPCHSTVVISRPVSPCHVPVYIPVADPTSSPLSPKHCTQVIRQDSLIKRFDDLYALNRLNAMDILRNYSHDFENNQRIIFAVVQESFSAAKRAFSDWKIRVRSSVAITHTGPDTLEEAVQAYINRNVDLYDLPFLTSEVILALQRNPKISLPCGVTYCGISSFIRESCRLAWEMSTLAYPLDTAFALDGEVIDESKYRRTYDSEYSAPLVSHHVWPCLMQGCRVISKGEACTRRTCTSVVTTVTRCSSPVHTTIIRERSVSPFRFYRSRSCHFH